MNLVFKYTKWADNIKSVQEERPRLAIVTANNHYTGFGPGTMNIFRNKLGLPQAEWKELQEEGKQVIPDTKHRTLSEFFSQNTLNSLGQMLIK